MKYSNGMYVVVGLVWLMLAGCGTSESGPSDESPLAEDENLLGNQEAAETIQASLYNIALAQFSG